MERTMLRVCVTGGMGFLGNHIVSELLRIQHEDDLFLERQGGELGILVLQGEHDKRKMMDIRVLDLSDTLAVDDDEFKDLFDENVEFVKGDITKYDDLVKALEGCDAVFHCASMVDFGNVEEDVLYRVNVEGTVNVINACLQCNVSALVYSSTLDVYLGDEDIVAGNEDETPYAMDVEGAQISGYAKSKTIAERKVLASNNTKCHDDQTVLRTCAIQFFGAYGPGDKHKYPGIMKAAMTLGPFNVFRIGTGLFQNTYVGNVAHAHVCALARLLEHSDEAAGEAFIAIDNTNVVDTMDFFAPYIAHKGWKVPTIPFPDTILTIAASLVAKAKSLIGSVFPSVRKVKMDFTPEAVKFVTRTSWFKTDKARRVLKYYPIFTPMEGRRLTMNYFDELEEEFPRGPYYYEDESKWNYYDPSERYYPENYHDEDE